MNIANTTTVLFMLEGMLLDGALLGGATGDRAIIDRARLEGCMRMGGQR